MSDPSSQLLNSLNLFLAVCEETLPEWQDQAGTKFEQEVHAPLEQNRRLLTSVLEDLADAVDDTRRILAEAQEN